MYLFYVDSFFSFLFFFFFFFFFRFWSFCLLYVCFFVLGCNWFVRLFFFFFRFFFFFPFFFFFFFLVIFRAAPMAYGGSQDRGQIGAASAGLHHSPQQHQIQATSVTCTTAVPSNVLNPLSKARDRTCVLVDTSQVRYH